MEEKGAGEIVVQSGERDGTMNGYDVELIAKSPKPFHSVICLGRPRPEH